MQHGPCVLIVDDDPNSLGEIALRIRRLGIDVFYAKDQGEAWLLAQQEATRIGVVMFPPSLDFEEGAAPPDHAAGQGLSRRPATRCDRGHALDQRRLSRDAVAVGGGIADHPGDRSSGRSLVVKARVIHARYPGSGESQRHAGGMGVEFSSLSPEAHKRLRLYLQGIEDLFLV